jgi:hypothetical protein
VPLGVPNPSFLLHLEEDFRLAGTPERAWGAMQHRFSPDAKRFFGQLSQYVVEGLRIDGDGAAHAIAGKLKLPCSATGQVITHFSFTNPAIPLIWCLSGVVCVPCG